MAEIIQLSEMVANQIAAGEVIERPASVVKELIENAIDANSNKILIEIIDGGKEKIRVKDNGNGIAETDLDLAFSRYATSKISNINDLYSIKTLGFRGEALSSIAAVSKITMRTKTKSEYKGSLRKLTGGKLSKKEPAGVPQGTDIIVEELFYNTPARYKYLKKTNTEFGHISNIVNKEALAYPEIQFDLIHNKHTVLKTPGTGNLIDTIYAIFGQELVDNLIPIDFEEKYIKIYGYIVNANFYRSSRLFEFFFVNQRSIYNQVLCKGVEEGYKGLLPLYKYPLVFINIKINQILVDINVHPTKREVRFSRDEIVKEVLRNGILTTLKLRDNSPKIRIKDNMKKEAKISEIPFNDYLQSSASIKKTVTKYSENINKNNKKINQEEIKNNHNQEVKNIVNKIDNKKDIQKDNFVGMQKKRINLPIKRIFGQIQNTYILAEGYDGLFIIDQHNAHERILYDKFKKYYDNKKPKSQSLLVPITLDITLPELEVIKKYQDELKRIGFTLEAFGGKSIIVTDVPLISKKRASKIVIKEIIDNLLLEGRTLKPVEMVNSIITYMSCRGAIKAGKILQLVEMERLVCDLFQSKNPFRCPHGREIIIHLTNEDIEKGMGRR